MKYHNKHEIAEKVLAELKDELEGICEYNDLYESLENLGMTKEAIIIERIAQKQLPGLDHDHRHIQLLGKNIDHIKAHVMPGMGIFIARIAQANNNAYFILLFNLEFYLILVINIYTTYKC